MKLLLSYKWSKSKYNTNPIFQVLDGILSQVLWAFSPLIILTGLFLIFTIDNSILKLFLVVFYGICLLCYIFIIPYVSCNLMPVKIEVRIVDWMSLPVAMVLKSIGPQLFFVKFILSLLFKKKIEFSKVER
jgi:hypothetical protein